jgi:hypothetical protein
MSPFCRTSIARCSLAALFLALAQWVVAPGAAEGACGDYVVIGGRAGEASHSGSSHPATETAGSTPSAPAPFRDLPCSGPQCRGETPRPCDLPFAPLKIVVRHWGMLAVPADPFAFEWRYARFDDDSGSPQFVARLLFRPPR